VAIRRLESAKQALHGSMVLLDQLDRIHLLSPMLFSCVCFLVSMIHTIAAQEADSR
jgi:hypothetical protein